MHNIEQVTSGPLSLAIAYSLDDPDLILGIRCSWSNSPSALQDTQHPSPISESLQHTLTRYLAGEHVNWHIEHADLKLDYTGFTPFRKQVVETLQKTVHYGETLSYGELAERAGRPGAARAVGQIMARNRWSFIYPCHRVIAAGGKLGGYGGALELKKYLLNFEKAN